MRATRRKLRLEVAVEGHTACAAPSSSLNFYPDGRVLTCCVNIDHVIGRVGESSLREMWDGVRLSALRGALAVDDFSLGCERCASDTVPGGELFSHAREFDQFQGRQRPRYPRRMDFVLSNRCNLQCVMCNGDFSSAIRSQREHRPPLPPVYEDGFFDELREFLPHLEVTYFLGGEPFLATEARRVWDLMMELELDVAINVVTNGTQWNERVEHYLRSLPMDLSVSIDGATDSTTAAIRVGADRHQIMENVARYRQILEPRGSHVVLNYCLMVENWREFHAFLAEADALDLDGRVVTVTDPSGFSLYALVEEDLERVVADLERQGSSTPLGRNRHVWETELRRLHQHLEKRGVDKIAAADAQARALTELAAWSGLEPLVLDVVDGRITRVDAPRWAAHDLDAGAWQSRPEAELAFLLSQKMGRLSVGQPEAQPDGSIRIDACASSGDALDRPPRVRLRAAVIQMADRRRTLIIASAPTC